MYFIHLNSGKRLKLQNVGDAHVRGDFLGVYSTRENRLVDGRAIVAKRLWYAWNWDQGTVAVQEVSSAWKLIGSSKIIVRAELESRFSFEREAPPEKPHLPQPPKKRQEEKPAIGNARTLEGVLALAETTAREDFDSGIKALELGDSKRAMFAFERPLQMDVPWRPAHKHMFSEFGSALRKRRIFSLALRHHTKALELAPNDENVWFNLARVHYSLGNLDKALEYLQRILKANPNMREGRLFMEYLQQKKSTDPLNGPPLSL